MSSCCKIDLLTVTSGAISLNDVVVEHWEKKTKEEGNKGKKEEEEDEFIVSEDDKQLVRSQLPDMILKSAKPIR